MILPKSFEAISKFKKQLTAIRELVEDLNKFSGTIRTTYSGIDEDAIKNLEANIGCSLPKDFKEFLQLCNGFSLLSDTIYGIHPKDKVMDIYSNYLWEKDESDNAIFSHLLPISPDGRGNHYCLDLKAMNIVFWQHDYTYSEKDSPDIDSDSFTEFLESQLNSVKEMVDYNGNDKQ